MNYNFIYVIISAMLIFAAAIMGNE
uniref:NADH dehydrogenase subunit 6 n=1 Tax=Meloidogyne hapla TaxID=6305 RepID=A0A1I8BJW7_MELHA